MLLSLQKLLMDQASCSPQDAISLTYVGLGLDWVCNLNWSARTVCSLARTAKVLHIIGMLAHQ